MNKWYWYRTSKIPRLKFMWLRTYIHSEHFYVAFDGELSDRELFQSNAVELGVITLEEFEAEYGGL